MVVVVVVAYLTNVVQKHRVFVPFVDWIDLQRTSRLTDRGESGSADVQHTQIF